MRDIIKHCATCKHYKGRGTLEYYDECKIQDNKTILNSDNGINCIYFSPDIFERIASFFGKPNRNLPESGGVIK